MADLDPKLLEMLVCPLTKGPLEYDRNAQELISQTAGLAYPIRNGIPIMLIDEARRLGEAVSSPAAESQAFPKESGRPPNNQ